MTDQQSATMMSCTGNPWLKTPHMDSLMRRGMRFEKAYAANPVCVPSRFSLWTGFYPSVVKLRKNGPNQGTERFVSRTVGHIFRAGGYETAYGGKVHLPGAMARIENCGFEKLTADQRDGLAQACVEYLRRPHARPFLLIASFINPHDICYQAILAAGQKMPRAGKAVATMRAAEAMPKGMDRDAFLRTLCPPRRSNWRPTEPEPGALRAALKLRSFRWHARQEWSEEEWRLHRWTYCRLTEKVDGQIGRVLTALRRAGLEENTIVVFTSDHGDMDGAHGMEHKSMTYEEAARIPLMVQYPGVTKAGFVDRTHLVSNGLDLLPTLCDLCGVPAPADLPGRSLKPFLGGRPAPDKRRYLMIETQFGRGITDGRYKYTLFDFAGQEEMLCDLVEDPGELRNLADSRDHARILQRMRRALAAELKRNGIRMAVPGVS